MDWNELQSLTWPGYARKNGGKGIRNRVLVIYTVKCAEFVAQQIVAKSGSTNVELLGFDGCTDNQYAVNLLISFIRHPNVGAVLAVGLGCEYVQPEWLSKIAEEEGKPTSWMFIQNEGGTQPAVRKGVEWVQSALKELENTPRVEMSVKDLVIGAECGGSDYTSGLAGNVVVDTDPAGNIKPTKAKSPEKIDGIVAAIMALDRCIRNEGQQQGSIYDERDMIVF